MGPVMTYCHTCMENTYHEIDVDNRTFVCWECRSEKKIEDVDVEEFEELTY